MNKLEGDVWYIDGVQQGGGERDEENPDKTYIELYFEDEIMLDVSFDKIYRNLDKAKKDLRKIRKRLGQDGFLCLKRQEV